MFRTLAAVALLTAVVLTTPALAGEPELDTPKAVAKALRKGVRKNDNQLFGAAVGAAREAREGSTDEELEPIVDALEVAIRSKNSTHQAVALGLLDDLAVPGSYRVFRSLLEIPDRLSGTGTRNVRSRAIMLAAELGGTDALDDIVELLDHPDVKFARTAARALTAYTELETQRRTDLLERLVRALARAERDAKHRKEKIAKRGEGLVEEIDKTLSALTGESGSRSAAEWETRLESS